MVIQYPKCPQTTDKLEGLLYALTEPRFDKTPKEYQQWIKGEVEKLKMDGHPKEAEVYRIFNDSQEEFEEAYKQMRKFGETREQAARNYLTHFKKPCDQCIDIYTSLLANRVIELMQEQKINPLEASENVQGFFSGMAHLEYLGHSEIERITGVKI